jgi:hypothetical protein
MYKVFLFPKENFLVEYDLGINQWKIDFVTHRLDIIARQQRERPWREQERNRVKYENIITRLKTEKDTLIKEQQQKIGLINSKEKAKKAIQYYISNNPQYQKCEFEIVKAKK